MKGAERQRWLAEMRFWRSLDAQIDRFAAEYQKNRSRYQRVAKARRKRFPPMRVQALSWQGDFDLDYAADGKTPLPSAANLFLALTEADELSGIVGYDLSRHRVMLKAQLPGSWFPPEQPFEMRPFSRDDLTAVQAYLEARGFRRISRRELFWAVRNAARQNEWRSEP
ncbi:hypothetical protein I6F26_10380 [Ensifer sp. IC3342]|nr:hypothetical protein [Ensifer sp. BRP08]MCA1446985.1 hypothetical protein [Ensifer sp. IC3342]